MANIDAYRHRFPCPTWRSFFNLRKFKYIAISDINRYFLNWRSCGDLKNWPNFWPGDLVPWPNYLSMSHTGTAYPFHMWTKFGDDMSKRSWVMLDKTDRQTDKPTNEHTCKNWKFWQVMKGQSEIAYLPKFANMMLIVMVIVITEILYIILIFDCFENQ